MLTANVIRHDVYVFHRAWQNSWSPHLVLIHQREVFSGCVFDEPLFEPSRTDAVQLTPLERKMTFPMWSPPVFVPAGLTQEVVHRP